MPQITLHFVCVSFLPVDVSFLPVLTLCINFLGLPYKILHIKWLKATTFILIHFLSLQI